MREKVPALRIMFLILYILLSFLAVPAEAAQGDDALLSGLRVNPKLIAADDVLADFVNGAPETAVIVHLQPSVEAQALAAQSRSSTEVPAEFTGPGAATYYNLQDESIRAQLKATVTSTVNRALSELGAEGTTVTRKFSYVTGFAAKVTPAALARIAASPGVVSVEKDDILKAQLAQGIPLINASTARGFYSGSGLSIAICDTGIDTSHPMLGGGGFPNAKVIGGYDTGDLDSDPRPDPFTGYPHGTACAGIAAGNAGVSGDYIGGVAPEAKLYALKITSGDYGTAWESAVIAAWEWAITHKNDDPANPIMIISTSFGGGSFATTCDDNSPVLTAAAANAVAAGMTIFASSGNSGLCDMTATPACISYVNSVGAVYDANFGNHPTCVSYFSCADKIADAACGGWLVNDPTAPDRVAAYSNSASFLTMFAPSNRAYTADITGAAGYSSGDYTSSFGGTSAACPYAAGSAAVLQHAARAKTGSFLTPAQVRAYLVDNGDQVADTKVAITKPRVNLARAIAAVPGTVPNFAVTVAPAAISVAAGGNSSTTVTTFLTGGFNNAIALSATGLPSGVTAVFTPVSIPAPGSGSSTLTLSSAVGVPSGDYTVTVTGTGGGITRNAVFTLTILDTVPNFAIAVSPAPISVAAGDTCSTTVTTSVSGGFSADITVTVAGLPPGATAVFTPASIPAPGSGSLKMALSTIPDSARGNYTVTVTGTGGGITRQAVFTLAIVQQHTLLDDGFENGGWAYSGAVPWHFQTQGVSPVAYPFSGSFLARFPSSQIPYAGAQGRLTSSSLSIPSGPGSTWLWFWMYHDTDATTAENIQVQVSTDGSNWNNVGAPIPREDWRNGWSPHELNLSGYRGTETLQVGFLGTGYFGGDMYLDDVKVYWWSPDFTIGVRMEDPVYIPPGDISFNTIPIYTTIRGGFNDTVTLTASGLPAGGTATFTPPTIAAPGAGEPWMQLHFNAAPGGSYTVTVTGTSGGGITHSIKLHFIVVDRPVQIVTTSLPNAAVNKPYNATVVAIDGGPPYHWSATGLPWPVTIDRDTGVISGTPGNVVAPNAAFASFPVTVEVLDGTYVSDVRNFTFRVNQTAPAAPTGLAAAATTPSGVLLSWTDNANNETVVQIERATNASFTTGLKSVTLSGDALTTYTDNDAVAGTAYFYRVRTGNYVAWSTSYSNTATVTISAPLSISTTSLANGAVNAAYNRTVSAVGGTAPYTWSVTGLPAGLTIGSVSGVISGTPANVVPANANYAVFAVTVTVTDSIGGTANAALTLRVNQTAPAAPSGLTATPTSPTRVLLTWNDNANNEQVVQLQRATTANFSTGLVTVSLSGTTLNSYTDNSVLPGTTYYYRVRSGNYVAWSATYSNTATATTSPAPLAVTTTSLANGAVNVPYSRTVAATGGVTPYNWSATGLPGGLTINAGTGAISGTPGSVVPVNANFATFPVTVTVTDGASGTASASLSLRINQSAPAAPSVLAATATSPTSVLLTWNDNANNEQVVQVQRATVANFSTGVTSVTLSGTALTSYTDNNVSSGATYYYRVRCGNYVAWSRTFSNTATVTTQTASLAISTTSLANGAVNVAYSRTVSATGGVAPYGWSATGLPNGLSINPSSGAISGTPGNVVPANATFATFTVAVTVTDGANATATASFNLRVNQSAPVAPLTLTATAASPTRVLLAWTDNANNEQVVQVQRSTAADFSTGLTSVTLSGAALTGYTDNSAVSGTTYYYRVRSGNYVAWSTTYSNTATVTTP